MTAAKNMVSNPQRAPDFASAESASQHYTWTATARPKRASDFESVLLAIAGHDLRQPLQIVQSAHDLLGMSMRTNSELKYLRSGQIAIDQLTRQLNQLTTALRFREHSATFTLTPIRVEQVLRQAYYENEEAALKKGINFRVVSTDAVIKSDTLLLGAALRNLVSNAVYYTEPGGRILVGCRNRGPDLRIDVYDNGSGIPNAQLPKLFEAFTRLDTVRREGLGIGLFIVRQALALLGHGIEVASQTSRGSRFSIFAPRVQSYA